MDLRDARSAVDVNSALQEAGLAQQAAAQPAQEEAFAARIGKEEIARALKTLQEYKTRKRALEERVIESETWWKLRQWDVMDKAGNSGNPQDIRPRSAWLHNVIVGKHADAVEAYPEAMVLPREEGDQEQAQMLGQVIPVVLEQAEFEETYSRNMWKKQRTGTAVYGVFWDAARHNGLGDVAIRAVDILNLFWEPGITDIQDSRNVFHVELWDNQALAEAYPQLAGQLKGEGGGLLAEYALDDRRGSDEKSLVVDWYYHAWRNGQKQLHYCKFIGNEHILFASENEPEYAQRGWYDDGQYPFVVDVLFPVEGSICGYGYVDIGKSPQECIDLLKQQLVINAVMSATPRYFVRADGGVNREQFADWTRHLIDVSGPIDEGCVRKIDVPRLDGMVQAVLGDLIEEIKYTTGNVDVVNGAAPSGVTAYSAMAALMDTAGRSSRAATKSAYRAFGRLVTMVIERIRQFYDTPRRFRITGQDPQQQYLPFDNRGIQPQPQGADFGLDMRYRLPVFDIQVKAARQTAYSRLSQNELAKELYALGAFDAQRAEQVLPMLSMMDFNGRDALVNRLAQNQQLLQMLQTYQQLALRLAAQYEPQTLQALAGKMPGAPGATPVQAPMEVPAPNRNAAPARMAQAQESARMASQPQ